VRLERAGGVVQEHACGAELRQGLRALDERLRLPFVPRAEDEAGIELTIGGDDRLSGLLEIRDVVERVVQAEDADAVLRRRGDEATDEVARDRTRPDEEPAAQCHSERRLRTRLDRADALPRALDSPPDRRVEDAAARDLERGEARTVEDLRKLQNLCGRHRTGQGLLAQQPDGRVDESGHGCAGPYRERSAPLDASRSTCGSKVTELSRFG
jgi:hypothetical protein